MVITKLTTTISWSSNNGVRLLCSKSVSRDNVSMYSSDHYYCSP